MITITKPALSLIAASRSERDKGFVSTSAILCSFLIFITHILIY
jgi:hypothetical protein